MPSVITTGCWLRPRAALCLAFSSGVSCSHTSLTGTEERQPYRCHWESVLLSASGFRLPTTIGYSASFASWWRSVMAVKEHPVSSVSTVQYWPHPVSDHFRLARARAHTSTSALFIAWEIDQLLSNRLSVVRSGSWTATNGAPEMVRRNRWHKLFGQV